MYALAGNTGNHNNASWSLGIDQVFGNQLRGPERPHDIDVQ